MASLFIVKDMGYIHMAHQLPHHDGLCANLHGHSYRVEVGVQGAPQGKLAGGAMNPQEGMIVDFGIIKKAYKQCIETPMDHSLILGAEPLPWVLRLAGSNPRDWKAGLEEIGVGKIVVIPSIPVTTAEHLASTFFSLLRFELGQKHMLPNGAGLCMVRVWETPTSYAEYRLD